MREPLRSRTNVSLALFLVAYATGAALIAVWSDFRFPRLRPERFPLLLVHAGAAFVVAKALAPPAFTVAAAATSPVAGVMGVAFPVTVYVLLAGFWIVRALQRVAAGFAP